jgi:hypothetical protein
MSCITRKKALAVRRADEVKGSQTDTRFGVGRRFAPGQLQKSGRCHGWLSAVEQCTSGFGHLPPFVRAIDRSFGRRLGFLSGRFDHNDACRVDEPGFDKITRSGGATTDMLPAPRRNAWFIDV